MSNLLESERGLITIGIENFLFQEKKPARFTNFLGSCKLKQSERTKSKIVLNVESLFCRRRKRYTLISIAFDRIELKYRKKAEMIVKTTLIEWNVKLFFFTCYHQRFEI